MSASVSSPTSQYEQMDDEHLKLVGDYKHGSIKRIKLKNFLTYTEVEFCPKPRLNMVVGPNGTGKSSILCAICLGLGGEPRLLGRASEIETFIQNGGEEALIELEIVNEHADNNDIVRRVIKKEKSNRSTFYWNNEQLSGKKVRDNVATTYQIQIDNLCTFLPQEKVGNFSGFEPTQLLLETEKCLSQNSILYKTHLELIRMQTELRGGDDQVDTLKTSLQHLQTEVQKLEREAERMKELEIAKEQVELISKKILWLEHDDLREECFELKDQKNEAKEKVQEAREEIQPLIDAHNEAKKRKDDANKEYKEFDAGIQKYKAAMEKEYQKYEFHDDKIEETLGELHAIDNTRAALEEKMREQQERLADLRAVEMPSIDDLNAEFHQARDDQNALRPQYQAKRTEHQNLQRELATANEELNNVKKKLARLNDEKAQRLRVVFQKAPEVRDAYEWINTNRNIFRKEVIGPIACEVRPKSNNAAAYLEQHVPNATLKSFVVQDKSDYDLLYREVREKKRIPINIIQIDRIPPAKPRMYSDEKMNMLKRQHGVVGYLDESFEAPEVVIQALISSASIEKVLVGNDKTQESMDNKGLSDILSAPDSQGRKRGFCIFTSTDGNSFKYTSQISRYSNNSSLRVDDIGPAKWLTRGASEEAQQKIRGELEELKARISELQPAVQEAAEQLEAIQIQSQEVQQRIKDAKMNTQNAQKMINKIQNTERKIEDYEAKLSTDNEEEKKEKVNILNQRITSSLKALAAHSKNYKLMMSATIKASGARLNREKSISEERHTRERREEKEGHLNKLEDQFLQIRQQFDQKKKQFKELTEKANTEAPLVDENGNDLPLKQKLLDIVQLDSVEMARLALEEAEGKIRRTVANENVVRDFEEKQRELEDAQDKLDLLTNQKEKRQSMLRSKQEPWEAALNAIIAKVDSRFSRYMNDLGCIGEIKLNKGNTDDEDDLPNFEDYGVEIRVSFREGVKPSRLSARVQSGGERSVSTIMYLMAMQDMMVAPFRCVDEINQGLDDRNERLVFKRIVENSTKPPGPKGPTDHCGQYWLITPKLLPNLTDMEVEAMNVICIFNGPYTLKHSNDWLTERLLAVRKRHRLENDNSDDDLEDTARLSRASKRARE